MTQKDHLMLKRNCWALRGMEDPATALEAIGVELAIQQSVEEAEIINCWVAD